MSANYDAVMAEWDNYKRTKEDIDRDMEVQELLANIRSLARLRVPEWSPELRERFRIEHPRQNGWRKHRDWSP